MNPKTYKLPPVRLFDDPAMPLTDEWQDGQVLIRTLAEFGVPVELYGVTRGPAVTRYELKPGAGVRISRIVALQDDLALALAAKSIRIEAPIAGKAAVGIEVPNAATSVVTISEILPAIAQTDMRLPMALGKDITGKPVIADLCKMPHLLVAGATGSGKSVCLNNIIASVLAYCTPTMAQMVMIDPKRVELTVYDGIPHLRGRVITDALAAAPALRALTREMDDRYHLLERARVRKIEEYNAQAEVGDRLPYIMVIIDELADLMLVAKKDIEELLCRLAQLARAVGIHLVVATQRPSVNVVTGLIKANIPSRIAFAVSSQVDSMTILDRIGAESLLGHGDMLFSPIDASTPRRAQGALVTSAEITRLVDVWRAQGTPAAGLNLDDASPDAEEAPREEAPALTSSLPAELISEATAYVVEQGAASTAALRVKFRLGHSRAAALMAELERAGVVGPAEGTKSRRVLIGGNT